MQVKDIMSRSVRTVTPASSLTEVVSLMCLYRYSGLPVVENGQLVGVIAEKDVLYRLLPNVSELMGSMATINFDKLVSEYSAVLKLQVTDLMTPSPLSVSPDMHILKAAAVMASRRFRRIPVTESGRLAGMLSLGDVHKAIFHQNLTVGLSAA